MRCFISVFILAFCLVVPISSYGIWITSYEVLDVTTEQGLLKVKILDLEYDGDGKVVKITGTSQHQYLILIPGAAYENDDLLTALQPEKSSALMVGEEYDLWVEKDTNYQNPQIERLSISNIDDKYEMFHGFMVKNICGDKVLPYIKFALQSNPNLKPTSYDHLFEAGWIP